MHAQHADLFQRAQALAGQRQYADAWRALEGLLRASPQHIGAWTLRAQLALQVGDADVALESIDVACQLAPQFATAQYTRGRIHKARGDLTMAIDCYRRARLADPANPDILTSLGIALRASGQLQDAIAAYRGALAIAPKHALASNNLANALQELGAAHEAEQHRDVGRSGLAQQVDDLLRDALEERAAGNLMGAMHRLGEALTIAPRTPVLLNLAATVAGELGLGDKTLDLYERLIAVDPTDGVALEQARRLAAVHGLLERAQRYTDQLLQLAPSEDVRVAARLTLPAVQESTDSIDLTRRGYEQALDELLQHTPALRDPLAVLGIMSFFLAYHGRDDTNLQIKAARLYSKAFPSLLYTAAHCVQGPRRPGKIRIGFISKFFYTHSIGKTTRGLLEHLDRERFDVHVIRITPSADDATTALIRAAANHMLEVDAQAGLAAARQRLAELELDILFYQDIGMEPVTYFLSFARLAPVQCVSYGHPNTTGVPAMDYFVSNDLYETPQSPDHYSERLFLLHDLPTLAYYYPPAAPPVIPARSALGLPEDATIYLCPQTLFKIHPDFDRLLRRILERDPRGRVVFIQGLNREWTEKLTQRFSRTMPGVAERVMFLPPFAREGYMELLAASDVMLDPPHFNGMNTSLEAFAVGLPVVTLPTAFQRGRHTRAMYLKMDISDCIAGSADEYVDVAVRLATDSGFRRQISERILSRNSVLYQDMRVVREFERFFITALREKGVMIEESARS